MNCLLCFLLVNLLAIYMITFFVFNDFQHIDVWVMYMWQFRPYNADWCMVSCYFLTLLLQGSMPLFYATNEVYACAWGDVDRVCIQSCRLQLAYQIVTFI